MKKLLVFSILLLLVSCECNNQLTESPQSFNYQADYQSIRIDTSRLNRLDVLIQEYIDKGLLPNALTFVAKNGQVIHNKVFGWRNVEEQIPLQKDDIFRMYSQTKAITTVALMTLFEQGKFQLDDPVSKYIPEMTDQVLTEWTDANNFKTRPAASPVLIRHILSHSSGISGFRRERGSPPVEYETLEEHVKELVKAPLLFDPGTNWNYHPASNVWGYLVEYFSGKSLQEYVQEVILEPLGITDMAYYYDSSFQERFVSIYREQGGKLEPIEIWSGRYPFGEDRRYAEAGTGLNGTIEGYARFCQMILNGGEFNGHRILSPRTIEIMSKDQLPHPNSGGENFNFGLGFQIYPGSGNQWNIISGDSPMVSPGSLSWSGMAYTKYLIDPEEQLIILFYTNYLGSTKIWEKYLNVVYQSLE